VEILNHISDKKKKFWEIIERILTQRYMYYDKYDKEKIDKHTNNVAAIKFFDADNTRIYCQEMTTKNGEFYIICGEVINKKVQKNNKQIKSIIKKVSSYDYEIIE